MPLPPPGVSERVFRRALRQFEGIVGEQFVFSSDEDAALYRDAYSPLWGEENEHVASAAVAPESVEEVQAIVRVANEHGIPLYPISTGRNLAYGGAAPVYSGSVVLDLKRMNRILDVNERDKTCLVEPGVSYFDLYRHIRENKLKLWIDPPDPGWGSLIGNALDHGGGYTGHDFRDHFDAHCGMEVVLGDGDIVRTGMGAAPNTKTWQVLKYGMGPWLDGMFSQSNYGIVTKMGFWLMEEPEYALRVSVSVPRREDVVPFVDTLHSLMCAHIIQSTVWVLSPVLSSPPTDEFVSLRARGSAVSDAEWNAFAGGTPFWVAPFTFFGPKSVVDAAWAHTKERLASIPGVVFTETGSHTFPLSDEEIEPIPNKAWLGIPSLDIFASRQRPEEAVGAAAEIDSSAADIPPRDGHLDLAPVLAPRGEELLAISNATAPVYIRHGEPPQFLGGMMYHPRAMLAFIGTSTFRNAEENRRARNLFSDLLQTCAQNGWPPYRMHAHFQDEGMDLYNFNGGALRRLHSTIKDAVDPNGIISAGRYGIWPRHLREG